MKKLAYYLISRKYPKYTHKEILQTMEESKYYYGVCIKEAFQKALKIFAGAVTGLLGLFALISTVMMFINCL